MLLLRLLGEISLSLLCSCSSWGSALDLAPLLSVGRLRVVCSSLRQDGVQGAAGSGALAHSGGGREWYGGGGASLWRQRRRDVAAAWGVPCVLPGKLSLDPQDPASGGQHRLPGGAVWRVTCAHTQDSWWWQQQP